MHVLVISFSESELAPIASGVSNSVLGCVQESQPNGALSALRVISRCTTVGLRGLYQWDLAQRDVAFELLGASKEGIDGIVVLDMAEHLNHASPAQEALFNILMVTEAIVARKGFAVLLDVPARVQDHSDTLASKVLNSWLARLEHHQYSYYSDAPLCDRWQMISTIAAMTTEKNVQAWTRDEVIVQVSACVTGVLGDWVEKHQGPSGAFQGDSTHRRPTAYSTKPEDDCNFGVQIINELNETGGQVILANNQAAIYLHVDDTIVYTALGSAHSAEAIMHLVADTMEDFGFLVPERYDINLLSKAIGYNIDQANARFTLPSKKLHQLSTVLFGLAAMTNIDVDMLRSVVGLYNFGAQLRRDLMSVPHAIYRMLDSCSGISNVVKQWPSVQRELRNMASLLPLMWVDSGWNVYQHYLCF